jgi:uncharacterized protein DUF5682
MINVLGIRHHGPGSTKSMLNALQALQPDIILIEGPPDADKLIEYVANPNLKPPVALLVYDPKDLSQAAYFPFAEFSPEWQAIKFSLKSNTPVRFMDLPQGIHFTLNNLEKAKTQISIDVMLEEENAISKEEKLMQKDPMAYAAKAAGYTDSERWWEVMFEQEENPEAIFPAIIDLIGAMRKNLPISSDREKRREAYMRNSIRKALKEGFKNIAVICGAWHAPVLHDVHHYPAKTDNAVLKGIKKVNAKATWVPWSFDRLSTQSGYRSGVISPAYYQLLYSHHSNLVTHWMSQVARLFRKEELNASSAHVIESVRLANTLSAMRGLSVPGLDEMYEAAVSIFCQGYESEMELIEKKLIIGDIMGTVPPEIPVIPLQQDIEKTIKTARLTKERNSSEKIDKELDLRKSTNLVASHLLHRLTILGIPWGTQQKISKRSLGNFKEIWRLEWVPDFAINIIEAGMWGNTLFVAANNFILSKAEEIKTLPEITKLVESTLHADLPDTIKILVQYLRDLSALTRDVQNLMEALPALVNATRYGSTRQMDIAAIEEVIENIIPRICIGLPNACTAIDEDLTKEVFERLLETNQSLNILNKKEHLIQWYSALQKISEVANVNGILRGGAVRILFDKEHFDINDTATHMRYTLSRANDSTDAAQWLEGFLYGSGLLLIHQPSLWDILDEWINELSMEPVFKELLPLLRRTFSDFSGPERQKMMALVKRGKIDNHTKEEKYFNEKRALNVLPTTKLLLGIK